jgi:PA domain
VKNAQDAGAIAVIIADNVAGSPPAGIGGTDPTITIPSGRVTITDGALLKANLAAGLNATLGLDLSLYSGADLEGRVLMFNPNPTVAGSSISHWDTLASPNLLMEPFINDDLTLSVKPPQDLTLSLMRDIGWYPDADLDGLADALDQCDASDQRATVYIDGVNTGIPNPMFGNGCTMADTIAAAGAAAQNHGAFVSAVTGLGNGWLGSLITHQQFAILVKTAAQSGIGK